jgi:hypothetical protein
MQEVAPGKATVTAGGLFSTGGGSGDGGTTGAVGAGGVEPQAADQQKNSNRRMCRGTGLPRRSGRLMPRECSTARPSRIPPLDRLYY